MRHPYFAIAALALAAGATAGAQQAGKEEKKDMQLVGYHDLQARSVYQPTIHRQGARYIAYLGHHGGEQMNSLTGRMENNGTSIVDVTNPRSPRYLAHIPGEKGAGEQGGAQMSRVCDGRDLPNAPDDKVYLLRSYGNSGHEIWDVTDPAKPAKVLTLLEGLRNTHKSEWECETGIAYVVSGPKDWRTRRMTKIYDLSNPEKPVFIRDFGLPGQQPGHTMMPVPTELHGPISLGPKGNRVLLCLRHRACRRGADRRSGKAPEWPEGADRREPRLSADRARRPPTGCRRPHGAAAARDDTP